MPDLRTTLNLVLRDINLYTKATNNLQLRQYQTTIALAILDSVVNRRGHTIVVMLPRQTGKNELQAQLESYLLLLTSMTGGQIVKASPTWRPQTLNSMRRLERVLARNPLTRHQFRRKEGHLIQVGNGPNPSQIAFFSAEPTANVVGATAKTLLECDEAQDVSPNKWDKDFVPMAASTNATTVLWGTAWTSNTLLARELRAAQEAEKRDGYKRAFRLSADDICPEVPEYATFLAAQLAKLGRSHPLIRTQYYSEEIDAQGTLFPPTRRALLNGNHPPEDSPTPGATYAILIDVAGADEAPTDPLATKSNRDHTTATIVRIDQSTLYDPLIAKPSYLICARERWTNIPHRHLYAHLRALISHWQPAYVVIDATGVGEGLASFLATSMPPGRLIPFVFSAQSKSRLGWDFVSLIETGRLKDHNNCDDPYRKEFHHQLEHTAYETRPNHTLRWGVPDNTRDPSTGELIHDDWVLSAALAAALDDLPWAPANSAIIAARDPLY